jgi:apolipoprotein N-acyltransferase
VSGVVLSLSLPPAEVWPLAFVAILVLLWLLEPAGPGRGAVIGFVFGIAYFGALLYWILLFGELAWTGLVVASAVYTTVFGALAPAVRWPGRPVVSAMGLACLWTGLEFLRGHWPLGGFAWGQLGSTQVDDAALVRLASVGGVWAVSFAVVSVSALLLEALRRARVKPRAALGLVAVAVAIVLAPAAIPLPPPDGRAVDVAAIQVDVREAAGLPAADEDRAIAVMNARSHRTLVGRPPDLAVWGEAALDPDAFEDPGTMDTVRAAIASVGAPTLAGAVTRADDGAERTEALLFDGEGNVIDRYVKVHLVPFGEYVPWRSRLSWISAVHQIPVDRVPGERVETVRAPGLPPFGTPVCYENSFPEIERALVHDGAAFLVLTINNASYGDTAASRQHLLMSRLRAIETGRWIVHAAISGVSAIIGPDGAVTRETELFETAVVRARIRASNRSTLYVRFGDWVPLASWIAVLALVAVPRPRRRTRALPESLGADARTLVILPTYEERATIERVLRGLLALPATVDVLVVDDGSPDGTADIVRAVMAADPRVSLLERPRKAGLASAYQTGFRRALEAGYDLVVEMDADLSHLPEELPRLLEAAVAADLVIGSRYVPGGAVTNWGLGRRALSRGGNLYARLALGFPVHDATSGFRVFRRELLAHLIDGTVRSDGYGFQIELAYRAWLDGFKLVEAPITFAEREHGRSKISRRIVAEALWLVTLWGLRARLRPSAPLSVNADNGRYVK